MGRVFVAPLGFHEDFILRSLVKFKATSSDIVYVVTCSPVIGAVKRAFDSLVAMTSRHGFPQPLLVELDCSNFYSSTRRLREVLVKHLDDAVIFCAGGGLRILTLVVPIALVSLKKPFTLHYEPEGSIGEFTVESKFFHNIFEDLNEAERKVLRIVTSNPGVSVGEIAKALSVKEKTVRNIVTRLKKRGLVVKKGRREGVEPTEIAQALFS
ncbi:MAG: CRISPR-associated CARF protein Csa3 [Desulfurococcaceae archaeon]